jgi:hypothetical protein
MHHELDGEFTARHYSLAELARLYQMDARTFRKHIAPYADQIGSVSGRYYSTKQVVTIVTLIGPPQAHTKLKE